MILSQRWLGARQLGVKAFKSGGLGMCVHPGLEKKGWEGEGWFLGVAGEGWGAAIDAPLGVRIGESSIDQCSRMTHLGLFKDFLRRA
jgi:hypothetical protein